MNENQQIRWYSPARKPFRLQGLPFFETDGIYRRLMLNPPKPIPELVDNLSNRTAGVQAHIRGRLQKLIIKARVNAPPLPYYHMTPLGRDGFDCYLGSGEEKIHYFSSTHFDPNSDKIEHAVIDFSEPKDLNIIINFPLYSGVSEVIFGVDENAILLEPMPLADNNRIVIYGTSITQGACASRAGMAHTNILSRRLNREIINLGFSGNGKCEAEMALAIRKIERTSMLIIETEGNCPDAAWIGEKYPEFIRLYREKYPAIPIAIISRPIMPQAYLIEGELKKYQDKASIQKKIVEEFKEKGDKNIYFYDGKDSLGEDSDECTVEGVHFTDLGFMRMANFMQPIIENILDI